MKAVVTPLFLLALAGWASADVAYTLEARPESKSVRVSIHVDQSDPTQVFRIPAWCPGFYFLLKYQDAISDVRAADGTGKALKVEPVDTRGWGVTGSNGGPIDFSYTVAGNDGGLGFFGVSVLGHTAFVNGPAAFMYMPSRKEEACTLKIKVPDGWDIATAMDKSDDGTYHAGGYDELLDHPIQVGKFIRRQFSVMGKPYEVIWVSKDSGPKFDVDALTERLRKGSAPAMALFRGSAFSHYMYLIHLDPGNFGGGLEHRASTTINVWNSPGLELDTLATHEYFHAWNVKQIRPIVLGPFDYTKEVRTGNLWFAEGVTDYYAHLHAYQGGLKDGEWLLRALAGEIGQLQSNPARRKYTIEDVCRNAWETGGFGSQEGVSYYTKGLIIGLLFDAVIRSDTQGKKTLDDVMRLMFERYKLPKPGYDEDGILRAINEISGKDHTSLYVRMVRSKEELPFEVLSGMGLRYKARGESYAELGFSTNGDVVATAPVGSGLRAGDRFVEVDGKPFAQVGFSPLRAGAKRAKIMRDGKLVAIVIVPVTAQNSQFRLERDPFASPDEKKRLAEWMTIPTMPK